MDYKSLVKSTLATPLGEMIAAVGEGVAEAQAALDEGSLQASLEIYSENENDGLQLLRDIGYRPTFYTLPETTGEISVALNVGMSGNHNLGLGSAPQSLSNAQSRALPASNFPRTNASFTIAKTGLPRAKPRIYANPVNAGYTNRFNFAASASAKITFKIVPVPPPLDVEELRTVPDLVGNTISAVSSTLESLGLEYNILNRAQGVELDLEKKVKSQDIVPATIVQIGTVIGIEFE